MAATTQDILDRFASAVENERLRADFIETLEDEPFSKLEEWAQSLTEVYEARDAALEALESWRDAEGREEKAEAKEEALAALDSLVETWNDSPLDLRALKDWTPEDAE